MTDTNNPQTHITWTKGLVEEKARENAADYLETLKNDETIPADMKGEASMQHLWIVGCWLQGALEDLGVEETKASSICREHGQRSFHKNPYVVAAWILNEVQAGTFEETPMEELGDKLMRENTRIEVRDGKRTVIMKVWSPTSASDLLKTVEALRNLPPEKQEEAKILIQAEMAQMVEDEEARSVGVM